MIAEILMWSDTRCACKEMKLDFKKQVFMRLLIFVTSKKSNYLYYTKFKTIGTSTKLRHDFYMLRIKEVY